MSGADFLDTNVLVYLWDADAPTKRSRSRSLVAAALATDTACISYQVVQETLNVLIRKFARQVPAEDVPNILRDSLLPLWRIHPSAALYQRALDLQARYGFSFYDSLIVAAALEGGCTRLLSEDLQHGQQIDSLTIENPFLDEAS